MVAQADMRRKRKPCFMKKHVKDAKRPSDILKLAAAHHQDGIGASDINTARIYSNPETLKAAFDLAIERGL